MIKSSLKKHIIFIIRFNSPSFLFRHKKKIRSLLENQPFHEKYRQFHVHITMSYEHFLELTTSTVAMMMVVLETHVVTQLTVHVVVAAISSSHVYRRTFVEWVAFLLLFRCTFILFFQFSAKCHSEHTHSEWCQTVLPLAYTRTDCEEETLHHSNGNERKMKKRTHNFECILQFWESTAPDFIDFSAFILCLVSAAPLSVGALCTATFVLYICIFWKTFFWFLLNALRSLFVYFSFLVGSFVIRMLSLR